jgi:hypothetical protein
MNGNTDNSGEIKVIIRTLALLAFVCVVAECLLSYLLIKIPSELNTITGGLVSALTAMLVKTAPTSSTPPPPDVTLTTNPPKAEIHQPVVPIKPLVQPVVQTQPKI